MTMYVQDPVYKKLRLLAKFRGITIQELLEEFLEEIDDEEQDEIGLYVDEF